MAKKTTLENFGAEEKKLLATVSGMPIYSDSVYVITGKPDESAPTGFQERGISKVPFPGNKTVAACSWDKYLGSYDTGFFERSMCYKGMSRAEAIREVELRKSNIMHPYELSTGSNLHQSNFDFWDSFTVDCYTGRLLKTDDIKDLFDLYIMLLSKAVTPKEEDGNPEFINSMYLIEDKTTAVDLQKGRQIDKVEIVSGFISKMNSGGEEKRKILDMLIYMDIISTTNLDDRMIKYMFMNWLDAKPTNIDRFKDMSDRFMGEDKRGLEIIKYNRIVRELAYSNVIKIESSGYIFGGEVLGGDSISSAMDLVDNKEHLDLRAKIIAAYSEMKDSHKKIEESSDANN